jgi:hypothetical protein
MTTTTSDRRVARLERRVLELEAQNRRLIDAMSQTAHRCPFCGSMVTAHE